MVDRIKTFFLNQKVSVLIQLFFIVLALFCLEKTDSLYNVYVFIYITGIFALIYNKSQNIKPILKRKTVIYSFAAAIFSICILLSGYKYLLELPAFTAIGGFINACINVFIVLIGSFTIAWNTLLLLDGISNKWTNNGSYKLSLTQTALICFFSITIIDFIYLFVFEYPGNITPDSLVQIEQLLSNHYTNHHPFYHTMIIKGCISVGMRLFNDINAAVACYSVFQIPFMALCFTYCVITLYQMKVPRLWLIMASAFFALMPYHIAYSITMWKDVPFGGAVLLFVTSLFRLFMKIGKHQWINWSVLIIGAFGTCLWRSNGWLAFAFTLIIFFICFAKNYKHIAVILTAVLLITYIMIHPVLAYLGVAQPDTIESLSIPAQQIARVIVDDGNISAEEYDMLGQIIDTNKIKDEYLVFISDPVKNLVRDTNNQDYLAEHKLDYLKLWISIGLKNPLEYIKAWIDQTKGYWNGGYHYYIWYDGVWENSLGIQKADRSVFNLLLGLKEDFFYYFTYSGIYDILQSIGLCTWTIGACGCINFANKRGKRAVLVVPLLAIVLTLCIATPVYSEFRYVYAFFTCVPLIICSTFYKEEAEIHG